MTEKPLCVAYPVCRLVRCAPGEYSKLQGTPYG
jgi:hypothetical protein